MKKLVTMLKVFWPKCRRWFDVHLVYAGVLLLVVFYFVGLTNYNLLLFLPLVLIICGIVGHVAHEKHRQGY
jgi:hypothetical protein